MEGEGDESPRVPRSLMPPPAGVDRLVRVCLFCFKCLLFYPHISVSSSFSFALSFSCSSSFCSFSLRNCRPIRPLAAFSRPQGCLGNQPPIHHHPSRTYNGTPCAATPRHPRRHRPCRDILLYPRKTPHCPLENSNPQRHNCHIPQWGFRQNVHTT